MVTDTEHLSWTNDSYEQVLFSESKHALGLFSDFFFRHKFKSNKLALAIY